MSIYKKYTFIVYENGEPMNAWTMKHILNQHFRNSDGSDGKICVLDAEAVEVDGPSLD